MHLTLLFSVTEIKGIILGCAKNLPSFIIIALLRSSVGGLQTTPSPSRQNQKQPKVYYRLELYICSSFGVTFRG